MPSPGPSSTNNIFFGFPIYSQKATHHIANISPKRFDIKGTKYFKAGDINGLANAIIDAINNINKEDIKYNQEKINSVYNWEANRYKLIKLYDRVLS